MNVLVTGGTKGIGFAVAKALAAPGALLFVNYRADDASAAAAAAALEALGARATALRVDAGTPEGCAEIAARIAQQTERLDAIVHCAVDAYPGDALGLDPHRLERAVATNGLSLHFIVQAALPLLGPGSSVVYLSSRGGREVIPNYAAVGVGKALGESLARYLAVELAPRGIRINTVAPAIVDTEAVRTMFGPAAQARIREAAAANPSGRGIRDDDITSVVRWLVSPEAEYVQGQVISINGGANLRA
jgi:NAD(P)-dependent dehydrogenase (short-subunit alcohol dehydrogenase family)